MKIICLIIQFMVSVTCASTPEEFLSVLGKVPREGTFQNCEIDLRLEKDGEHTLVHVYLKDLENKKEGYSLFPIGPELKADKISVQKKRAFIRLVNDIKIPHIYEDFVLEWDGQQNLKFMSLRKFKSYGIYWDFDFNIKCGESDITI